MIEASVKRTGPITVAFLSMRGSYDQIPASFGRLYGWIGEHGYQPTGMPQAVYLTAPDQVPEDQALWEVQSPIAGEPEPSGPYESGLGVKRVEARTVATTMHRGPYEAIEPTYRGLVEWIADNGYEIAGPSEEVYFTDPNEAAPEDYLTEVVFPIRSR